MDVGVRGVRNELLCASVSIVWKAGDCERPVQVPLGQESELENERLHQNPIDS